MPRYGVNLKMPGGGYARICGSKPMRACICEMELAPFLCDHPMGNGKTCDRPLGEDCRTHVDPDLDFCPDHAPRGGSSDPGGRWSSAAGDGPAL